MNATHTPGPWTVEFPQSWSGAMSEIFAPAPRDESLLWRVAYVMRETDPQQQAVDDANARLITAAPELLDALRDLLNVIAVDALVPESVSYMRQARAALAKAEGRA